MGLLFWWSGVGLVNLEVEVVETCVFHFVLRLIYVRKMIA